MTHKIEIQKMDKRKEQKKKKEFSCNVQEYNRKPYKREASFVLSKFRNPYKHVSLTPPTLFEQWQSHNDEMGTEQNALSHVLHIFINYRCCPQCSSLQPI